MRAVSSEFVAALDKDERIVHQKAFIIFRSFASYCSSTDPSLASNTGIYNVNQVFDNRISTQDYLGQPRRFLAFHSATDGNKPVHLDGTWRLLDDSGSFPQVQDLGLTSVLHTQEAGWKSTTMSDINGNCNITLTVNLSQTQAINALFFVGNPDWGFPVNCTFYVSQGGQKINVGTLTGNTTYFIFQKLSQYYNADYIQINITKLSRNLAYARCTEFVPLDGDDITNRVMKWDTLEERNYAQNQQLPYGNSSKNKLTISLDNTDGAFYTRNMDSPYYRKLKPSTQFRLFLGLELADKSIEWTNRGAFYAIGNFATSLLKAEVDVEAWNLAEKLDRAIYTTPVIYQLTTTDPNTVVQLVDDVVHYYNTSFGTKYVVQDQTQLDDRGQYTSDWSSVFSFGSDSSIPFSGVTFAYLGGSTYFQVLNDLCFSILGWVDISEEETIIINTEFQSNRVFNALTNGDWEDTRGPNFGWSTTAGVQISYAPQNLVHNGTNSGLIYTSFPGEGIYQSLHDPFGLTGRYTFQACFNTFSTPMRMQVLGLDSNSFVYETYFDKIVTTTSSTSFASNKFVNEGFLQSVGNGTWEDLTQDFYVTGDHVTSIQVKFTQVNVAPMSFMLDNVLVATQAVYSFVAMLPTSEDLDQSAVPPPLTFGNINSQDIEDKFSVDKIVNQVTVVGVPLRLGLGSLVAIDGGVKIYYGNYFPSSNTWTETIGLGTDDERILLGRFQLTHQGVNYYATVSGNDPTTFLYGPFTSVTGGSGSWALLNTSYYYAATAINAAGESTLGPIVAMSFDPGQQQPQLTVPAIQDTWHYRVYRALTSFSGDNLTARSYIDLGVGTVIQAGWPSDIILLNPIPDQAGNPQLVFSDPQNYVHTKVISSTNTAPKAPVIYLQTRPQSSNGLYPTGSIVNDSFIVYPFETLHDQQQLSDKSLVIDVGQSYSYNLTFSKTPVYITQSPTVWTMNSLGNYSTPEGVVVTFDNLNDSGGAVSYIGLTLNMALSQLTPSTGLLILENHGTGPLQPFNLHIQGPALQQIGGVQAIATNQNLIDQIGLKDVTITNSYIQSTPMATTIASRVLQRWKDQGLEYDIKMPNRAPLHLQVGDKISLWDAKNSIFGAQFIVVRIDTTYDGGASATISVVACH